MENPDFKHPLPYVCNQKAEKAREVNLERKPGVDVNYFSNAHVGTSFLYVLFEVV